MITFDICALCKPLADRISRRAWFEEVVFETEIERERERKPDRQTDRDSDKDICTSPSLSLSFLALSLSLSISTPLSSHSSFTLKILNSSTFSANQIERPYIGFYSACTPQSTNIEFYFMYIKVTHEMRNTIV